MNLSSLDWSIVFGFFALSLGIGALMTRQASRSSRDFFLSGRNMPWWLLGISMVATTFSADTPNLVTDIVRKNGVAGNWAWWAFLLTGMLTVFVYAKLWRRSGIFTDIEFYELRYSGRAATFLRAFRALYLGVFFNVVIMASVCLAGIKIGEVLLGLKPIETLLIASVITVTYSALGGLKGVIITDFFQFLMAMVGAVWAAVVIVNLPEVNGLQALLTHPQVQDRLSILPDFNNWETLIPLFLVPIAVQWWSVWYPGAEPGGGGYVVQRILAAKDERNAMGATLLFNVAHYALRPWPWILIALASLIVFPDMSALQTAFPGISPGKLNDDLAYSAMLTYLPSGLLGLVVASLIAAFMSTISTHLNWGSSYIVHDFYHRFIEPEASERKLVRVGRLSTVGLMLLSGLLALALSNALQAFNVLLQIGAGTGLIFILRWFWWRINAYTELAGMIISFAVALYFEFIHNAIGMPPLADHYRLLCGVCLTTVGWIAATFLTPATEQRTLEAFYLKVQPAAMGWRPVLQRGLQRGRLHERDIKTGQLPLELACMIIAVATVYAALFATGFWLYGQHVPALVASSITLVGAVYLFRVWKQLNGPLQ